MLQRIISGAIVSFISINKFYVAGKINQFIVFLKICLGSA